ncbi:MAG: hypothetical protein K6T85_12735 [Gorillibacterium sp.]|nr:hypothetical protein [Gorillibacterium sp.]
MTVTVSFILVIIFIAFCIGWVRLLGIRLSSVKVMLLGIHLSVAGGMFIIVDHLGQFAIGVIATLGLSMLFLGAIMGILGFFIQDEIKTNGPSQ